MLTGTITGYVSKQFLVNRNFVMELYLNRSLIKSILRLFWKTLYISREWFQAV